MYAVILAAGGGTRLRPLRGAEEPPAFQTMPDGRTLLEHTTERLVRLVDPMDIVVVANRRHGQLVRAQLPEGRIVTQPMNRGTATSLALAIVSVERPADETMIVINADHDVQREDTLKEAISIADRHLVRGAVGVERPLVMFAVRPAKADPELTYIVPNYNDGARIAGLAVYPVNAVEPKPQDTRARQLYESGNTYWSSGIYVWQKAAIADALQRYTPLFTMLRPAHRSELALSAAYDGLQPVSIEEGVLAGAARDGIVVTVPLEFGWQDLSA
jgi:mannose-1-phosphate guanylyltransferase